MFVKHRSSYLVLFFLLLVLVSFSFFLSSVLMNRPQIIDFLSCAKKYPVMESYPRRCKTSDGKIFVERVTPSVTNTLKALEPTTVVSEGQANIIVHAPIKNQIVGSQFSLKGSARVFENILHYRLSDSNGEILASGNLEAKSPDVGQFGEFSITVTHKPTKETQGILTVFSYSPKDGAEINTAQIPVRFVP